MEPALRDALAADAPVRTQVESVANSADAVRSVSPRTGAPSQSLWLLRIHYRMRALSFAMIFLATTLQVQQSGLPLAAWVGLILTCLVYPHLQYWRALRAAEPVRAELNNMLVDSALLGAFAASLHFPVWMSFSSLLGATINLVLLRGWKGLSPALLAAVLGACAGAAVFGASFRPATPWPAALACMVGLTAYLLIIAKTSFAINQQLRRTREALRFRERELLLVNSSLEQRLLEIEQLRVTLNEQVVRDALTGLHNRRYLNEVLPAALNRCLQLGDPLSLLMIDIDHFKAINDNHGHAAGDRVLVALAQCLTRLDRPGDVLCRYGGEEFVLVLPGIVLSDALHRAEQIRLEFASQTIQSDGIRYTPSLSIGVAEHPQHGLDADALVERADHAMYLAKRAGRNRVEVAVRRVP